MVKSKEDGNTKRQEDFRKQMGIEKEEKWSIQSKVGSIRISPDTRN